MFLGLAFPLLLTLLTTMPLPPPLYPSSLPSRLNCAYYYSAYTAPCSDNIHADRYIPLHPCTYTHMPTCIPIYIYTHAHIYIYIYIYAYIRTHTYIYIYIRVLTFVHILVDTSVRVYVSFTHMYTPSRIISLQRCGRS